jgi:hypothetical protein
MKVQPMASALRVSLSLREARALAELAQAGAKALGLAAPGGADDLVTALRIGASDLAAKQASARANREAKRMKPARPPMMNLTIAGLTISATLGDWIDISESPDFSVWSELTPDRESHQGETRYGAWRVLVLNPSPYGSPWLGYGCTRTGDKGEVEALAHALIAKIDPAELPHLGDDKDAKASPDFPQGIVAN